MKIESRPTPLYDERPSGIGIDTIVIHAMHAPAAPDPLDASACIDLLESCRVSAHYIIARDGTVWRTVPEEKRAWHAGDSRMPYHDDSRENVNHFSIGIELVGREDQEFTSTQYQSLAALCAQICAHHAISAIVGHEHIAPLRKTDPGVQFNWGQFQEHLLTLFPPARTIRFGL